MLTCTTETKFLLTKHQWTALYATRVTTLMLKITLKDLSEHHGTEVIIKIVVQNAGVQQQYQK